MAESFLMVVYEVMLVMSFSETPLASAVLSRGVGGVSPRAIAPVEPRAGSSKRVHRPTRITRDHLARPNAETWRRQGEFCNAELASVRWPRVNSVRVCPIPLDPIRASPIHAVRSTAATSPLQAKSPLV